MSLILGVNLPQFLYLVSDTRLTRKFKDRNCYQDNFSKFHYFNKNVSVVTAGNAKLANYILKKLGKSKLINKGFLDIEKGIKQFIIETVDAYLKDGNKYQSVVLIFAGFDGLAKKQINASHYGDMLAKTHIAGEKQIINKKIIQKIVESATKGRGNLPKGVVGMLEKDFIVETDFPYSSITTIEIDLSNEPIIKKIDCYKYVMRAPNKLTEDNLPEELAYKLEQQQAKSGKGEDTFQIQTMILMAWVNKIIEDHKLDTVGGDIMVNIVTPEGSIIMIGALCSLNTKTKKNKKISEIIERQGKLCIRSKNGEIVPLQNIYDFDENGEFEI